MYALIRTNSENTDFINLVKELDKDDQGGHWLYNDKIDDHKVYLVSQQTAIDGSIDGAPTGTPHNKFEEYANITIQGSIYSQYATNNNFGSSLKYGKTRYSIPAFVFLDCNNWINGNFIYNTGAISHRDITATATAGETIFWRTSSHE